MQLLFDFFPLIVFFAAYKFYGIFVATAVAIAASAVQVGVHWLRSHRFETMHLTTLGVIVVFGGMTLLFRDDTFIKWKPTIVNWIFASVVLASQFSKGRTILEVLLGSKLTLPVNIWRNVNLSWGLFFLVAGALNLYVAFLFRPDLGAEARTDLWVNFKVFGLMGLTLVFAVVQMLLISRHLVDNNDAKS